MNTSTIELFDLTVVTDFRDTVGLLLLTKSVVEKTGADTLTDICPSPDRYCVRTATLVAPRVTPPASLNTTLMRLFAGSNGTVPVAVTNTE